MSNQVSEMDLGTQLQKRISELILACSLKELVIRHFHTNPHWHLARPKVKKANHVVLFCCTNQDK